MEPRWNRNSRSPVLDWEVSFQRRVGAANRGVLAFVALDSASDRKRVLVPLGAGEALWIAVMAGPAIVVSGHFAGERARTMMLVHSLPAT
jgi:hypothetical protein